MEINCRILRAADSLDYRKVRLESLTFHPECFGSDYHQESKRPKLYFQQLLESESTTGLMLGAFAGQKLVGLCGLIPSSGEDIEIIQMYVGAEYRGTGAGLKLLSLAKHCLSRLGGKALVLKVFEDNQSALATYQKAGFSIKQRQDKDIFMVFTPGS